LVASHLSFGWNHGGHRHYYFYQKEKVMIHKIKDWQGWWDGMRSKAMKAGAEAIVTNLTTMLGSNGVASMIPSLHDYALTWKTALITTVSQFIIRVVLAGAQYVFAKPDPDVIEQNIETTISTRPDPEKMTSNPGNPINGGYATYEWIAFMALMAIVICLLMGAVGCSHFNGTTTRTYFDPKLNALVTEKTAVKAGTFFDSKSGLTKMKNSITTATSGTTVGELNQESSGSNAIQVIKIVVEGAATGAAKALVP
jgi:hypothetical protein